MSCIAKVICDFIPMRMRSMVNMNKYNLKNLNFKYNKAEEKLTQR